jgi:hypothetical protein
VAAPKKSAEKSAEKSGRRSPSKRKARAPNKLALVAAVHEPLLEALKKPLTKEDLRPLFEPLALARTLSAEARGITFAAAVAKKRKDNDSTPVAFVRALGAALTRAGTSKQRARLANKALDAMRGASQWDYLSVAPELLFLAEIAGPERLDRALRFYETADLALDGLVEKLLLRAVERGEDTLALRQLAAHAPTVRPIVSALRDPSATDTQKQACARAIEELSDDARLVFDQLLCGTADRENDLVWPSLARLLTAPSEQHIHRTSLRNALATLRFVEGIEPLLASIADKPEARARLAALIDNDSSEYALELVLHALRERAGDPMVFARVERAFTAPGRAAAELCSEWFRDQRAGAWSFLSDEQRALVIDGLVRADRAGISEARHALYSVSYPGCEARVREELARIQQGRASDPRDDELYWSLVFALGHIGTDSAVTFVRELAFDATDNGVWECCSVLGSTLTDERFESHMAAARARRDPHAALSILTTVCTDFIERGALAAERDRLLIELARVAALTKGASLYRAHVLVEGVAAALRSLAPDVVNELSAALGLEKAPTNSKFIPKLTSRFCELYKSEYTSPFVDDSGQKLLRLWAESLDGTLAARMSSARLGPVEGPLTDDVIELIAASAVRERFITADDEVWFIGEDSKLHIVDRSGRSTDGVLLASELDPPSSVLTSFAKMDERLTLFDNRRFIEAQRYGDGLLLFVGADTGHAKRYVLRFRSEKDAAIAVATLRAFAPSAFYELNDPWMVDGLGGVIREYRAMQRSGEFETEALHVVGFDDEAARASTVIEREASILRDGGTLLAIKCAEALKRNRDRSVHEWLSDRVRDDEREALWHIEALREAERAIATTGIAIDLAIEMGAAARDEDLAALARACTIPAALGALWSRVGSAEFRLKNLKGKLLSPRESLALRAAWDESREALGLDDPKLAQSFPLVVIEQEGTLAFEAVFDGSSAANGRDARPFTSVSDSLWWEQSLGWILATGLLAIFSHAVLDAEPALAVACYGERAMEVDRRALSLEGKARRWWKLVRVDRAVGIWAGKEASPPTFERKLYPDAAAARSAVESAVSAKQKQGFTS